MNTVFILLLAGGIGTALFTGQPDLVVASALKASMSATDRILTFIGIISLWLGLAKIAERSGLLLIATGFLQPFAAFLFPSIPKGHPALGAILMNFSANLLGMGSAATPFGLKAMEELQKLNRYKDQATTAMCTFLAINTSSITLIPATIIAFRSSTGSQDPTAIVGTMLFASTCSTLTAITADYFFRRFNS